MAEPVINPHFLSYNTDEVQTLLGKVSAEKEANEADVRAIVTDYDDDEEEDGSNH